MAAGGVDTELVDDLEGIFAPLVVVDEGVMQRGAVFSGEGIGFAKCFGGGVDIGSDNGIEEAGELGIGEVNAVEGLEVLAEIDFEGGAVVDIGAVGVAEILEFLDEIVLDVLFGHGAFLRWVYLNIRLKYKRNWWKNVRG